MFLAWAVKRGSGGKQREILWAIFEKMRSGLKTRGIVTWANVFAKVSAWMRDTNTKPFDFAVLDEAQDLSISETRFLASMAGDSSNDLFFLPVTPGKGFFNSLFLARPLAWMFAVAPQP